MLFSQDNGCGAGMITGIRFGLLVTGFMLLIHNDQTYIRDREEDGTACSENHEMLGDLIVDLFVSLFAFCIGESAMIDDELIAEDLLQAGGELGSQGNLRNEIEHVLPLRQLRLNQMNVYIRLI